MGVEYVTATIATGMTLFLHNSDLFAVGQPALSDETTSTALWAAAVIATQFVCELCADLWCMLMEVRAGLLSEMQQYWKVQYSSDMLRLKLGYTLLTCAIVTMV